MVLLPVTEGLGIDDDLVFFIDGGDTVVALDRAFGCLHLGTLIVGDIAFNFLFSLSLASLTHRDIGNAGFAGAKTGRGLWDFKKRSIRSLALLSVSIACWLRCWRASSRESWVS